MTQVLVVVNARLRDATFLPTGDPAVSWSQGCSSELSAGKAGDSLRDFDTFLSFTISGGFEFDHDHECDCGCGCTEFRGRRDD